MDFPIEQNLPVHLQHPSVICHIWVVKSKSRAVFEFCTVLGFPFAF